MTNKQIYNCCKKSYMRNLLLKNGIKEDELLLFLQKESDNNMENHLKQQDLLLDIIKKQSKPQFGREVLANLTADAIFEVFLKGAAKIFKI